MAAKIVRRKPRADAAQNRERLIAAAKEVLGNGGPSASLEAVARHAGVGIGTLYRHFPNRELLFQAVYRHEVSQLIELADAAPDAEGSIEPLRAWMHAFVGMVATKRGLLGALSVELTEASKAMYAELSVNITAAVDRLVQRTIAAGSLRPDVSADDLLQTVFALCYAREPEPGWEDHVLRLLDIFIDGLVRR